MAAVPSHIVPIPWFLSAELLVEQLVRLRNTASDYSSHKSGFTIVSIVGISLAYNRIFQQSLLLIARPCSVEDGGTIMRFLTVIAIALTVFASAMAPAFSQGIEAKASTIKDTLVILCLAGGSETTMTAKGDAELRSKIKDILTGNMGATVSGGAQFNKKIWEGIVGGISKDMTDIQSQQASEARKCMVEHGFSLLSKVLASQ